MIERIGNSDNAEEKKRRRISRRWKMKGTRWNTNSWSPAGKPIFYVLHQTTFSILSRYCHFSFVSPSTLLPPFESNIFSFFLISFLTRISSGQNVKKKNYSPMEKIKIKPREEHSFFDVELLPRSEIKIKFSSRFRDSIFESYFLRSEISFLAWRKSFV